MSGKVEEVSTQSESVCDNTDDVLPRDASLYKTQYFCAYSGRIGVLASLPTTVVQGLISYFSTSPWM